jgi:hypothetical protein
MGKFLVTDFEGVIGWIVPKRRVRTDLAVTVNVGEQRTRTAEVWPDRMKWFTEQMEEIPKRFGPFLKIRG